MGNLSALLFVFLGYLVPLWSPTLRKNTTALWIAWLSLSLRHGVALVNAFVTPILASWGDIYRFHNIAAGISAEPQNYGILLKLVYKAFGTSFWLGEETSILVYSLSLVLFVEIGTLLKIESRFMTACVAIFALLPSPLIHTSVILREPFQALGFLGTVYALFVFREKPKTWAWPLLGLSLFLLVFMHQGLAIFVVGVMTLAVPWALQGIKGAGRGHLQVLIVLSVLLGAPIVIPKVLRALESESHVARALNEGRLLEYTANYRSEVREARSDYGVEIDTESLVGFISTGSLAVLMFFIAPLPWQASSAMDYYAFAEVCLRIALLYGSWQCISKADSETRKRMLCLLWLSLSLDFLWALGTSNWGTSLRHHVVSFGGLVLLGGPYLASFTLDPQLAALHRRREANRQAYGRSLKTTEAPGLRKLMSLVRSKVKPFVLITALTALAIAWTTWPARSGLNSTLYTSRASLLLPSNTRFTMKSIFASTGQSDLDFWLSNEVLFDKFMKNQRVYDKLELALQRKHPKLAQLSRAVSVLPVRLYIYEKTLDSKDEVINPFLAGLETAQKGTEIERDYAQIYLDEEKQLGRLRVSRIIIQAMSPNPADSQTLAIYMAKVLQKELENVATRKSHARRQMIEKYLRLGRRKIESVSKFLIRHPELASGLSIEKLQERQSLERRCLDLSRSIRQLEGQLSAPYVTADVAGQPDQLVGTLEKLQQEYRQATQTFVANSPTLLRLQQQLQSLQKFATESDLKADYSAKAPLRLSLQVKKELLAEAQASLRLLRKAPSGKVQKEVAQREREVEAWETEQLQWEEQLLQTRIEERLCRGDGTAVLLQSPSPGRRARANSEGLLQRYAKTLKFLPVAPLLAISALVLLHLAGTASKIGRRAEYFLDAPVLGELPVFFPKRGTRVYRKPGNSSETEKQPG